MKTEIIFDFDDTLYPTSALNSPYLFFQYRSNPDALGLQFKAVQESAIALLNAAIDIADRVKIITNGARDWVVYACKQTGMSDLYDFI